MSVSTSGLAYLAPRPKSQAPLFAFWPALSAVVGFALPALGLLGALLVRPGAKKAKLSLYLTLVLVLTFVGIQVACGGGGSPPPPPGGGGGQTFTITVTGTSGSLTHSAATTLTVR